MARLEGFEPPTSWFVAKHSNPTELQAHSQIIKQRSHYGSLYLVEICKTGEVFLSTFKC